MKKIFLSLLIITLLSSCTNRQNTGNVSGCDLAVSCNEPADMSSYEFYVEGEDYVFVRSDVRDMLKRMDDHETFIVYFGFSRCPWCRDMMPILNDAAKEAGYPISYIDTREKEEWKSNIDIDDYDLLAERFKEYLQEDENGIPHLYTPFLIFIKDGEIVKTVSAPDYDAHEERIPDNEKEALYKELLSSFELLK